MEINLTDYIKHPERMDAVSLGMLRMLVQRYPYFQAARLLLLRNLYQLHDSFFGEELRKAALFVPDRRALFQLIEGHKYTLEPVKKHKSVNVLQQEDERTDRTQSLIDTFLSALPEEKPKRVRPVDAATDYMAYLLQTEAEEVSQERQEAQPMNRQDLIDDFIGQGARRIILSADPDVDLQTPQLTESEENDENEDYFTETLARIYIKQGKYDKAIEIIRRLSLKIPKKNRYFADQIRFLEKLIINNKYKQKEK